MKKKTVKKLRLSRETLQALTSFDAQKVVGGSDQQILSCESGCCGWTPWTQDPTE